MPLSDAQIERYGRQLFLDEVGRRGQERFAQALVRVVGTGKSAEEATTYLCAAGIGALQIDIELARRIGDKLKSLNPELQLSLSGAEKPSPSPSPCLTLTAIAPDTRLTGAMAGLTALMELLEPTAAERPWDHGRDIRWEVSS